jgi:hypothetical protein
MACPNFKKGMKMAFGPLRVKVTFLVMDLKTSQSLIPWGL